MMINYPKSAIFLFPFKFQHSQLYLHPIMNAYELILIFLLNDFFIKKFSVM